MNPFLADLYGTAQNIGSTNSEVEKLAQAEVVDQVLRSEGLTVDQVSPDAILKVAEQLFGPNNELAKHAEEAAEAAPAVAHEGAETPAEEAKEEEEKEEEMKEAMAQADFLGRMIAHAQVDELNKIAGVKEVAGKAVEKGKDVAKAVGGFFKSRPEHYRKAGGHVANIFRKSTTKPGTKMKTRLGHIPKSLKEVAPELGLLGAAGAGAGGYAYHKKHSAIDTLAEQRASEILEQQKLANSVEERAWQILAENGYVADEE